MTLNHINLVVRDVDRAAAIFVRHLGFRCLENRKGAMAILQGEDSFVLVLWSSKLNKSPAVAYPENFHIGFYQRNEKEVTDVFEKLREEGLAADSRPGKLRNTFGFYFQLDGVLVEISVRPV